MNHFGELVIIQILLAFIIIPLVIGTQEVEPVDFLLSKNSPRNATLYLPNLKEFKYSGDTNDCCVITLFIQVKDVEMQESGNEAEPAQIDDNEDTTETGQVILKFDHPQIRNDSKSLTMDVKEEPVSKRHLIHFDNCGSITQVIFFVYANTTIIEDKDVKIIVLDGKERGIECKPIPTTKHEKEPKSDETTQLESIAYHVKTTFAISIAVLVISILLLVICAAKCIYHYLNFKKQSNQDDDNVETPMSLPLNDINNSEQKDSECVSKDDDKTERCRGEEDDDNTEKNRGIEDDDNDEKSRRINGYNNIKKGRTVKDDQNEKYQGSKDDGIKLRKPVGLREWFAELKKDCKPTIIISVFACILTFVSAIATVLSLS